MKRLTFLVIACASASLCLCHVLHTSDGLAFGETNETIKSLDTVIRYNDNRSDNIILKRFKRDFIGTNNCPRGLIRFAGRCITCELYEQIMEETCPLKKL